MEKEAILNNGYYVDSNFRVLNFLTEILPPHWLNPIHGHFSNLSGKLFGEESARKSHPDHHPYGFDYKQPAYLPIQSKIAYPQRFLYAQQRYVELGKAGDRLVGNSVFIPISNSSHRMSRHSKKCKPYTITAQERK
jgi:hypothetical protein